MNIQKIKYFSGMNNQKILEMRENCNFALQNDNKIMG